VAKNVSGAPHTWNSEKGVQMQKTVLIDKTLVDNRALALVDIENLAGTPQPSAELIREIESIFYSNAHMNKMSQTYISCNHLAGFYVGTNWERSCTLCFRSGQDGADLALLEQVNAIPNLKDFHYVVIGSGDHIFAPLARKLKRQGHFVHVIARPESLSGELRRAASHVSSLN